MMNEIFIGIDLGSSGLKAVAIDGHSGVALCTVGVTLAYERSPSGGCQIAGVGIHTALHTLLRKIVFELGPRSKEVRAIACTGHGAGLYALNNAGELVNGFGIASTDQRAGLAAMHLSHQIGDKLFEEVGSMPWGGQPTMIAAELSKQTCDFLTDIQHVFFAKDYLTYLLTGEIATDHTDAGTAGLISLEHKTWSSVALEAVGLSNWLPDKLPPLQISGSIVGTLLPKNANALGLPLNVPVAIGAIDLMAAMTAAGATQKNQAVSVFGTWCVNAMLGPIIEPKPRVGAIVSLGESDLRLYMENSPASMANITWLAKVFGMASAKDVMAASATAPRLANGVRFLPYVNGSSSPAGASGTFLGLKAHCTRADMARAVVESVAALHAIHIARFKAGKLSVDRLSVLGGGARDLQLTQLLANLLDSPVHRIQDEEATARGAAMYAAKSCGYQIDAVDCPLLAPSELVEPQACEVERYAGFVSQFDLMTESMSAQFVKLSEHRL